MPPDSRFSLPQAQLPGPLACSEVVPRWSEDLYIKKVAIPTETRDSNITNRDVSALHVPNLPLGRRAASIPSLNRTSHSGRVPKKAKSCKINGRIDVLSSDRCVAMIYGLSVEVCLGALSLVVGRGWALRFASSAEGTFGFQIEGCPGCGMPNSPIRQVAVPWHHWM